MPELLRPNEILSMSAQTVRRLLEAGDGDCALLYLALLREGSAERARAALHWGDGRLDAAYRKLAEMELVEASAAPAAPAAAAEEVPTYNREDVVCAMEREPEFCGLYREVERLLGRELTDADLTGLYTVYDGLAFSPELILLLVNYVIRTVRRQKQNPGAVPRMSQIKSEAFRWKRLGLDSTAAADAYIRSQQLVDGREWAILSAVGVTQPRPAVEKEREYIGSWVELGIGDELIAMAYERTVYQKGRMNWPYMNKILLSWHQAGYRTPQQVKAGDRPAARREPAQQRGKQLNYEPSDERIRKNSEELRRFLEDLERGG